MQRHADRRPPRFPVRDHQPVTNVGLPERVSSHALTNRWAAGPLSIAPKAGRVARSSGAAICLVSRSIDPAQRGGR